MIRLSSPHTTVPDVLTLRRQCGALSWGLPPAVVDHYLDLSADRRSEQLWPHFPTCTAVEK